MKVQIIDFIRFYNDEDKKLNGNLGTGATTIITDNQMVTRINEKAEDKDTGQLITGLGRHEQEKGLILSDIFSLHKGLFQNREQHYRALQSMNDKEKAVLEEVVEIRYSNNDSGNSVIIKIPKLGITTNQYIALEYLIEYLESINELLSKTLNIWVGNDNESIAIENNYTQKILTYLQEKISLNFHQSVEDVDIIAKEKISKKIR